MDDPDLVTRSPDSIITWVSQCSKERTIVGTLFIFKPQAIHLKSPERIARGLLPSGVEKSH